MGNDTAKATGIRVRFAPDREIPIDGASTQVLREMCLEQANDLFHRINSNWDGTDWNGILNADSVTEEVREKLGGLYWMLGEARERLSDFLMLTEDARTLAGGNYGARVASDPAAHEFAGAGR